MKGLAAAAFAVIALQQPQPPALLANALKAQPGVRLLNPAADLREYTQAELQKLGDWPPWLVADFDRDKRPDVAAVVVKPSPSGSEFGVIAVHARSSNDIQWIIDFDVDRINGVAKGQAPDIETRADLPLYGAPNIASKPVTTVPHCTSAVVLKVGGTPDRRWYFVETPEGHRGWIPDTLTSGDVCVG